VPHRAGIALPVGVPHRAGITLPVGVPHRAGITLPAMLPGEGPNADWSIFVLGWAKTTT
jgi:hypothetical protein